MGLSNFTSSNDDDDQNNNSGSGSGFPGLPGLPPMSNATKSGFDVEDVLVNYNERFKTASPALFREKVIEQALTVLIRKDKPNALLVGPAGVGKTRIVEEIARMIATHHVGVPAALRDKTIYELPIASLVAGAGIVGQLESRVAELVDFATDSSNNVVLFIDEIHVLGDNRDPIYSKIAQMLKPALARGDMHVIGATTAQESRKLDDDPAFQRRFSRLIVDELTREQTVSVLMNARTTYMAHHQYKVTVTDEITALVATIADEYSRASQHRPDNAVTLLDQALADVVVSHGTAIAQATARGDQAVAQALQSIPTLSLTEAKLRAVAMKLASGVAEKSMFDAVALRESMRSIKGQDDVLDELVDTLRRDDLGAFPRKHPVAWMLAGPSGAGKTETVKRISNQLTGQKPIILNMGEYAHNHDVSKLIGAGPGYVGSDSNKELPFDTLESNPYRVILLDEIEKADRAVHRLLLTALDDGWMRMADGKIVDFSKATIIATTNAARDVIGKQPMGFSSNPHSTKLSGAQLTAALKEFFDAEFLGRFQKLVAYSPITRELYREILESAYERERQRLLDEKPRLGAQLAPLSDPLLDETVQSTFLPELGARPAERAARRLIEDALLAAQQQNTFQAQSVSTHTTTSIDETDDVVTYQEEHDEAPQL
ncbi:MAG TPA: AAA family ATPase [Candidatus Lumbricidophila sp.]|nr:AAA family ATPase [Candidatus Lumbricidophila sp.]